MTNQHTAFLALILIGSGSSWATAATIDEAVAAAGRVCSRDWGKMFTFTDEPVKVNVYALPSLDADWHASDDGLFIGDSTARTARTRVLEHREVVLSNED